jgi:hypothetical protein
LSNIAAARQSRMSSRAPADAAAEWRPARRAAAICVSQYDYAIFEARLILNPPIGYWDEAELAEAGARSAASDVKAAADPVRLG